MLARRPGPVLWIATRCDLYPPALARAGLDPARLVLVQVRHGALRQAGCFALQAFLEPHGVARKVFAHIGFRGGLWLLRKARNREGEQGECQEAAEQAHEISSILRRRP